MLCSPSAYLGNTGELLDISYVCFWEEATKGIKVVFGNVHGVNKKLIRKFNDNYIKNNKTHSYSKYMNMPPSQMGGLLLLC